MASDSGDGGFGAREMQLLVRVLLGYLFKVWDRYFTPDELEEICAEAIYRAWPNRERLRTGNAPLDSSFTRWTVRIAHNVSQEHYRAKRRRQHIDPEAIREPVIGDGGLSPDASEADSSPELFALLEILSTLTDLERRILLTDAAWTRQLSKELGINAGALRTRRYRLKLYVVRELRKRGFCVESSLANGTVS